jgi:pimeloyl-ACP methyl ester carboxylesterase
MRRPRYTLATAEPFYRGGTGEPLVLIHGFTDTWATWRPILPQLEAHHEVFAPTLAGHHGGQEVAPGSEITDTMFADSLERQLDELGFERAHLVGNSLGGWLALKLAERGRALSAVAICPAGGWYPRSLQDLTVALVFLRNAMLMRTGNWWIRPMAARPRLRRLAVQDLLAPTTRLTADQARLMFEGAAGCQVLHETLALSRREPLFGDLGPIDCRVRVLYGTRDRMIRWPAYYARLRKLLPQAEYLPLEGMAHLAMWDDPATVAERVLEVTRSGPVPPRVPADRQASAPSSPPRRSQPPVRVS